MTDLGTIQTIAIIDDDKYQAETIGDLVLDAGYRPRILEGVFRDVSILVERIRREADAAVCDHRLAHGGFASFPGAEAVAGLYRQRIPSVLLTQYFEMDADVAIRKWRPWIPVVLGRNEVAEEPELILQALSVCQQELNGFRSQERRTQRSLIRIADTDNEGGEPVLDVFVSTWEPLTAVRIPLDVIPEELRGSATVGTYFVAMVNTDAERSADLYFDDIKAAPAAYDPGDCDD
ncbi:MAG TPA: hypothetical protein VHB47_03430 [Thermoanaerobaculia bacterium]|jgi:hypothetical protein|nr:hypothetical protein [Thermoanaerobaculia bacterium]